MLQESLYMALVQHCLCCTEKLAFIVVCAEDY